MGLSEDLERVAALARTHTGEAETLTAVIPTESGAGERIYLCAFSGPQDDGSRTWLALDAQGKAITERTVLRDAVAIAALCEIAEDVVGADDALQPPPRLASPSYLGRLGAAARARELADARFAGSSFAQVLQASAPTVEELELDVERGYKVPLR